eukprot:scaffold85020_cov33-Phaeocystis_antarctica.AAC.1
MLAARLRTRGRGGAGLQCDAAGLQCGEHAELRGELVKGQAHGVAGAGDLVRGRGRGRARG